MGLKLTCWPRPATKGNERHCQKNKAKRVGAETAFGRDCKNRNIERY